LSNKKYKKQLLIKTQLWRHWDDNSYIGLSKKWRYSGNTLQCCNGAVFGHPVENNRSELGYQGFEHPGEPVTAGGMIGELEDHNTAIAYNTQVAPGRLLPATRPWWLLITLMSRLLLDWHLKADTELSAQLPRSRLRRTKCGNTAAKSQCTNRLVACGGPLLLLSKGLIACMRCLLCTTVASACESEVRGFIKKCRSDNNNMPQILIKTRINANHINCI